MKFMCAHDKGKYICIKNHFPREKLQIEMVRYKELPLNRSYLKSLIQLAIQFPISD